MGMGRLIAGGLLAGLVLSGADFVASNFLLADRWQDVARRHSIDRARMGGDAALVTMLAVDFLLGFVLLFTYAAVRPRFGPGPGTAAIASLIVFLPAGLLFATFGGWFIPWDLYVRQTAMLFVSMMAAGVVGAGAYGEKE
jgi:hypothetical protein